MTLEQTRNILTAAYELRHLMRMAGDGTTDITDIINRYQSILTKLSHRDNKGKW